ncbi:MAG TPA: hypothetical protein P5530_02900 [Candidatus Diapherotrites archaeon]|nr:hypothetical protein [Candidatus Diapherotrites archaeon]
MMTKEQMFEKLENVVSKIVSYNSNVLIITHNDLDGFVSAYCLEKLLQNKGITTTVHSLSNKVMMHDFDNYCNKIKTNNYNTIVSLDVFNKKFLDKFKDKNYFAFDHHSGMKKHIGDNIINISNFFDIEDDIPSMGAYFYGYTIDKVSYPSWFSVVARFTDGLYKANEFFVPIDITNKNYLYGLPRIEILDFISFINSFYNYKLDIEDIYIPFKECIDSNDLFYYKFSNSKELIYLRKIQKIAEKEKYALLKKCLKKAKKCITEKTIIFEISEKENKVRRLVANTIEYLMDGYNILFLAKTSDGYIISFRTNNTKFDVIKNLKPIYDEYCHFEGHAYAAGGFVKTEFKKRFINDTIKILKNYNLKR